MQSHPRGRLGAPGEVQAALPGSGDPRMKRRGSQPFPLVLNEEPSLRRDCLRPLQHTARAQGTPQHRRSLRLDGLQKTPQTGKQKRRLAGLKPPPPQSPTSAPALLPTARSCLAPLSRGQALLRRRNPPRRHKLNTRFSHTGSFASKPGSKPQVSLPTALSRAEIPRELANTSPSPFRSVQGSSSTWRLQGSPGSPGWSLEVPRRPLTRPSPAAQPRRQWG